MPQFVPQDSYTDQLFTHLKTSPLTYESITANADPSQVSLRNRRYGELIRSQDKDINLSREKFELRSAPKLAKGCQSKLFQNFVTEPKGENSMILGTR